MFHFADIHGLIFFILKNAQNATDASIMEVARATVCFEGMDTRCLQEIFARFFRHKFESSVLLFRLFCMHLRSKAPTGQSRHQVNLSRKIRSGSAMMRLNLIFRLICF